MHEAATLSIRVVLSTSSSVLLSSIRCHFRDVPAVRVGHLLQPLLPGLLSCRAVDEGLSDAALHGLHGDCASCVNHQDGYL